MAVATVQEDSMDIVDHFRRRRDEQPSVEDIESRLPR